MYKLICDLAISMSEEDIEFFLKKIEKVPINEIGNDELKLLSDLGRRARVGSESVMRASSILWSITF